MGDCPTQESLERLLREELGDAERKRIEAHVEGCAACQETLHRLASGAAGPAPHALRAALSGERPRETEPDAETFLRQLQQRMLTPRVDGPQETMSGQDEADAPPEVEGYEVLEELGRGAMGVVYRARHRALNRPVALKMILSGPYLSPAARRRFELEAQAIARLRHPNIVQIYDVGEQAACPYLSLELVEGQNLAGWLGGVPHRAVESARIVAALAGAVEYAHSQGVIHRDLKPANVLLAADGTPKITDFGLAKILPGSGAAEDRMTQSGMILGTPAYIAPEQARGQAAEVGPTADVYSLGAILYEVLTGRPPFQGHTLMETLLRAAHQEPEPAARVPRDLNTICLKCLEKEPGRRYATAGELAADLERFLNHEPIRARPPGRWERFLRSVRRHPTQAAVLAGILVLAMILAAFGLWQARQRAEAERVIAQGIQDVDRLQRQFSWSEAGDALERTRYRLGYGAPADLRARLDQTRRDLELAARLDAIRLKRSTVVEGRFDVAADRRFNLARADRDYEKAFREAGWQEIEHDPEVTAARGKASSVRGALVAALDDWAVCAVDEGRRDWLLGLARRADPDAWRDRIRDPSAWKDPATLAELARTAAVAEPSAPLLVALGERLQAIGGDATAFLSRVQQVHPDDFWSSFALGKALHEKGEAEEAISAYRKALTIRPNAVPARINIGHARYLRFRLEEADGAMENDREALRIDPRSAPAYNNLGVAWKAKGRLTDAIDQFREALRIDPELAPAHFNLGDGLAAVGKLPEAIDHYGHALRIDPDFARAHYLLGEALLTRSRFDEANEKYRQALRIDPRNVPAHDRIHGLAEDDALDHYDQALDFDARWAPAYKDLGHAPQEKSRLDEAIDHQRQAVRIDPGLAPAYGALGQALLARGQFREARTATRRCLELLPQAHHLRANLTRQLQRCERLLALEGRLQAVLGGKDRPTDAAECLDFADLCRIKRQFADAARFFADARLKGLRLADDTRASFRYNAPITALLAGSGLGEDGDRLSEAERARWRQQAREWLQADLAAWSKELGGGAPANRALAIKILTHWRTDPDLAGLHDPDALEKLLPAERQECRKLRSDIDALIDRIKALK